MGENQMWHSLPRFMLLMAGLMLVVLGIVLAVPYILDNTDGDVEQEFGWTCDSTGGSLPQTSCGGSGDSDAGTPLSAMLLDVLGVGLMTGSVAMSPML